MIYDDLAYRKWGSDGVAYFQTHLLCNKWGSMQQNLYFFTNQTKKTCLWTKKNARETYQLCMTTFRTIHGNMAQKKHDWLRPLLMYSEGSQDVSHLDVARIC